jgi:hypothetical protein
LTKKLRIEIETEDRDKIESNIKITSKIEDGKQYRDQGRRLIKEED